MADLTKKYFDKRIRNLVTKEGLRKELKNFATKDDLKNFATKDDLRNFATKDDLKNFATKDDLRNFATKNDLDKLAAMISRGFEEVIRRLDVRERVEELEKKVSRIMEAINLRA
jgi:hypothetical protein